MRRIIIPILILVASVALWMSTIVWLPKLALYVQMSAPVCQTEIGVQSDECKNILGQYGATGDLFGAMTSLFSGLALFAVAWTLWIEGKAARESKKPLIVCYLGKESISLEGPTHDSPKSLKVKINATIANQGEPALNVCVEGSLWAGRARLPLDATYVQVPLVAPGVADIAFALRPNGPDLNSLLQSLLANDGSLVELSMRMTCTSLEGVKWATEVSFHLSCENDSDRKRLLALQGTDPTEFDRQWAGSAAVATNISIKPGTWTHSRS